MQRPDKFLRTEFQAPTRACTRREERRIWKRFIHWVAIGAPRRDRRQGLRPHRKSRATRGHARTGVVKLSARLVLNNAGADGCSSRSSFPPLVKTGSRTSSRTRTFLSRWPSWRVSSCGDDGDQERPQERLPKVIDASTKASYQAVSLASEQRLEVARLLGTSSPS